MANVVADLAGAHRARARLPPTPTPRSGQASYISGERRAKFAAQSPAGQHRVDIDRGKAASARPSNVSRRLRKPGHRIINQIPVALFTEGSKLTHSLSQKYQSNSTTRCPIKEGGTEGEGERSTHKKGRVAVKGMRPLLFSYQCKHN